MPGALALPDELGRLEAVEPRHLHVQEDHGEVLVEQPLERLLARGGRDQVMAERAENRLEHEEVLLTVVDEQHVGRRLWHQETLL